MVTIEGGANEGDLVAKPAIDPKVFERQNPQRFDHIFLHHEGHGEHYRYRLTVVDRPTTTIDIQHVTAVVLIPAGRESEFMFHTQRGLLSLAQSAGCARLIAVAFGRHHEFESQQAVQEELTFVVQVISQQGIFLPPAVYKRNSKNASSIPFMALDGIGSRNVLAEGETTMSGKYLVEQVKVGDQVLRRLYFMENPFVIQSEVALLENDDDIIDKTHLAFDYHKHMCAGIMALCLTENEESSGLVIGLGGGGLVNFLQHVLPNNNLAVVELDESVVTVAEQYFGFERGENKKTSVHIGDGLSIQPEGSPGDGIAVGAPLSMNFIGIDVDSKDKTVGMSCPPQAFVDVDYLKTVKSMLRTDGLLVINVSARDPVMLELVMTNVKAVFETVFVSGQDEDEEDKQDLNVVVFAIASKRELPPRLELMKKMQSVVQSSTADGSTTSSTSFQETISELEDSLAGLAIGDTTALSASTPKSTINNNNKKKKGGSNKKKKGKRK